MCNNQKSRKYMTETVYLMVRVEVESSLKHIADTVHELENETKLILGDTQNVKVVEAEILLTRVRKQTNR